MDFDHDNSHVHRLHYSDKEIILVGTAHVSRDSVNLVERVILEEKPDTICVELCQSRYQALTENVRWQDMDIAAIIRDGKAFLLLTNLLLSSFQKKIAEKFGVRPGEEMIKAIDIATDTGAIIHLADREINVTLSRTWSAMSISSKVKLMGQILISIGNTDDIDEEDIERMKNDDALQTILADVGKAHPMIRKTLIDERDQYLCHKIRTAPGNKIVAVVGAGHVPGILKYLNKPIDIFSLSQLPPRKKLSSILKWGILAAIIPLITWVFCMKGSHAGAVMIGWWVGAHAIPAGLGASMAFGHPATVLSAMIAAPITSLNPQMGAGWVSGLTETHVSKPSPNDLEALTQDTLSVKGFWKNKVTRTLLVVVFTNAGATIGTFLSLPLMIKVIA